MPTHPSHDRLGQLTADVDQLVNPIRHLAHRHWWDRHRNRQTSTVETWHPPLLDQLRDATATRHTAGDRRGRAVWKLPLNLDALDRYQTVLHGLLNWAHRTGTLKPAQPGQDWHGWAKTTLRTLAGAAPTLAPSIADQLAADIHQWWRWAAHAAGWKPDDLTTPR